MDITQVLAAHGVGTGIKPSGTATAADVLATKTFINASGEQVGAMAENGAVTITPGAASVPINAGHHNGLGVVSAVAGLSAGNIKATATVGGVAGTFTNDANAVAADLISTKSGYVNGTKINGSTPLRTAGNGNGDQINHHLASEIAYSTGKVFLRPNPTPSFSRVAYEGDCWVEGDDADFDPANFRADKNMFGMQGSMTVYTSNQVGTSGVGQPGRIHIQPGAGYWDGTRYVYWDDANFAASNIRNGTTMYGVTGTLIPGKRTASGTATITKGFGGVQTNAYGFAVGGLSFQAGKVFGYGTSSNAFWNFSFVNDYVSNIAYIAKHVSTGAGDCVKWTYNIPASGGYANGSGFGAFALDAYDTSGSLPTSVQWFAEEV